MIAKRFIALIAVIGFSFAACNDGSKPVGGKKGAAPKITTEALENGTVGTEYSQTLAATGDTPFTWSVGDGLPIGLSLAANGVISGTPSVANTFNFVVKAVNAAGSDMKALSITIESGAAQVTAPKITTAGLQNGTMGTAYSQTLVATGTLPITWTLDSGTLPAGIELYKPGIISGTPTAPGTSTFTVKATNSAESDTKQFSIHLL